MQHNENRNLETCSKIARANLNVEGGGGGGGREPGIMRGGRGTGGGRKKDGKRDSQSGGNREKRRKISQYCVTFHNRNRTKRREPLRKGAGSGSKRYGRWEFQTPLGMLHV